MIAFAYAEYWGFLRAVLSNNSSAIQQTDLKLPIADQYR